MNYVFLRERVENSPFTPIQQKCLDSIGSRVPSKLKESPETQEMLKELNKEISDNFLEVIIKHTGNVFSECVCVCVSVSVPSQICVNLASLHPM